MPTPIPDDLGRHLGLDGLPRSLEALSGFLLDRVHELNNPVGALVLHLATQRRLLQRLEGELATADPDAIQARLADLGRSEEQLGEALAALRSRLSELAEAAWALAPIGDGP